MAEYRVLFEFALREAYIWLFLMLVSNTNYLFLIINKKQLINLVERSF